MYTNTQDCKSTAPAMAATGASTVEWPTSYSTVQTGNANGGDWQEKVYEKIKSMKEMYLSDLSDLYEKIAYKMQQRLENEKIEKLKMYKIMLERIMLFLRLNKQDIQLLHKEKLVSVEKNISKFLRSNLACSKTSSSPQQGQLHQSSMQLQQPQSLGGQTNPPMQPVQGSMEAMQQSYLTNLQQYSLSGVSTISNSQQHMINVVKPGSRWDLGQGNSLNSPQQVATGSLQQNPVNSLQHDNISSFSTQGGMNPVQANLESLQQNSNVLPHLLPTQHEQQMLQNQQLTPLCNQLLMQQQLFQSQQLMKRQQAMNSLQQLMQQNNFTNLHHDSLSGVSTNSNSQQDMINTIQPGSNLDLGQGNFLSSLQQVSTGSLQQNHVNRRQHVNISSLSPQSGTNPVQANLGSLQQNSNVLQRMSQSQQMLQNQRQMQQLLLPRQPLMKPQQMEMKTGILRKHHLMQQQSVGQRVGSHHPQMKLGISSPQLHKALSPQVTQHPSPQIDQQNMLASLSKAGTPLQSSSSPVVIPSPSTPLASSPMTRDSEKVSAGLASHNTAGNIMHQQATLPMEFKPHTSTVEAPLDSSAQTGNINGTDWQEEVYQKIKSMREMYLSELNDLYWKTASEMQQHPQHEIIEKLKIFKMTLERIVLFLLINKREIQLSHKEKLFSLEKYITFFLSGKSPHNPTTSPLHRQLP
ncbi:mediator of RNA polymerase II transcription subunit 15a-like [Solanum stenotomum]|uniref:mediator of RNA polymerase II transcription subunit 15a-like n=1 Tax=Solanum stenotomum TaxID=172797 RepID=UPI0020D014C9|nr:mediator of RNA polymerase II transcription subunit 15a-like [Solanum stenotomum]